MRAAQQSTQLLSVPSLLFGFFRYSRHPLLTALIMPKSFFFYAGDLDIQFWDDTPRHPPTLPSMSPLPHDPPSSHPVPPSNLGCIPNHVRGVCHLFPCNSFCGFFFLVYSVLETLNFFLCGGDSEPSFSAPTCQESLPLWVLLSALTLPRFF